MRRPDWPILIPLILLTFGDGYLLGTSTDPWFKVAAVWGAFAGWVHVLTPATPAGMRWRLRLYLFAAAIAVAVAGLFAIIRPKTGSLGF